MPTILLSVVAARDIWERLVVAAAIVSAGVAIASLLTVILAWRQLKQLRRDLNSAAQILVSPRLTVQPVPAADKCGDPERFGDEAAFDAQLEPFKPLRRELVVPRLHFPGTQAEDPLRGCCTLVVEVAFHNSGNRTARSVVVNYQVPKWVRVCVGAGDLDLDSLLGPWTEHDASRRAVGSAMRINECLPSERCTASTPARRIRDITGKDHDAWYVGDVIDEIPVGVSALRKLVLSWTEECGRGRAEGEASIPVRVSVLSESMASPRNPRGTTIDRFMLVESHQAASALLRARHAAEPQPAGDAAYDRWGWQDLEVSADGVRSLPREDLEA